ncbi:hypothetical protein BV20DRAFT_973507 [Pilatotrama ljubarskyi]|nr:hypothetical protein BV20DRAFT_973507 [Pilatotrama ljubarskyi]
MQPDTEPTTHSQHWLDPDDPGSQKLGALAVLARKDVQELAELVELRKRGWEDDRLNSHFASLREVADIQNARVNWYWYKRMKGLMGELDEAADCIPASCSLDFLDVGCAPGGFSACVLEKNRHATGVGLTLPASAGGYAFALQPCHRRRYRVVYQDILLYRLHGLPGTDSEQADTQTFPEHLHRRFSLIILDAHALRIYPTCSNSLEEEKSARAAYRDSLLIAQFIIALSSVRPGGTIVAKLSHVECFPAAHLVYMLDAISDSLVLHKPRMLHSNRGTFYAIAKAVGSGSRSESMARHLGGLRDLWRELRFGGARGTGRYLFTTDLDFIVTADAILEEYVDRLVELGRGVWSTQVDGLRYFFRKKGLA